MSDAPLVISLDAQGNSTARSADGRVVRISCNGDNGLLSSRELLLASLGGCLAASLAPLLQRHETRIDEVQIVLTYGAGQASIQVDITLPAQASPLLSRLQRAAANCPVRKALALPVDIEWKVAQSR